MDFRDLSKKYWIISSEGGVALFTTMMLLVLVSGLSLFMLQNAATEMQITSEVKKEFVQTSLAESGIEQALAWFNNPTKSPNPLFFANKVCKGNIDNPGERFSSLIKDLGETITFRFYESLHECVVEASASSGKTAKVTLAKNPMPPMADAIYGLEDRASTSPVFVQGSIRFKSDDPELETRMNTIRKFAKRFGRYFIVSPEGTLEENGVERGTFDAIFAHKEGNAPRENNNMLVFIDTVEKHSSLDPLKIGRGHYKGYFYFFGDIEIEGGGNGLSVLINPDLSGFFYTRGRIVLDGRLSVYGALYTGLGFEGDGVPQMEVWYNSNYQSGSYKGVLPLIPLAGTWIFM